MLFSTLTATALAAGAALASPIAKRVPSLNVTDTLILQYALTAEHLEFTFYTEALAKMDAAAFKAAGFPDWVRNRFQQICNDEGSHVFFLETVLGNDSVMACNYSFPYTDPVSFTALAAVIENVGISAYLGAAPDITVKGDAAAAASILSVENQHQAWIASAVNKGAPWSNSWATPLSYDGVYTILSEFITSCPASNPTLPFAAYPSVTVSGDNYPGGTAQLSYADSTTTQKYLQVYYGLDNYAVPINEDKTVAIPSDIQGTAYAFVSSSGDETNVDVSAFIAGPAILNYPFVSSVMNPYNVSIGTGLNM